MALIDALRAGVKVADKVTKSLQTSVDFYRSTGTDAKGNRTYAPKVTLHAIVDNTAHMVRTREGVLTATRATVTLLNVNEVVAATNGNGVQAADKIVFPDGEIGAILAVGGYTDPGTGDPVATTLMMG